MCVPVEAALYLRHNGVLWPIDYFFRHRGPCLQYQVEGTFAISPSSVKCLSPSVLYFLILSSCSSIVASTSTYTSSRCLCSSSFWVALSSVKLPATYSSFNGFLFQKLFSWHQAAFHIVSGRCLSCLSSVIFSFNRSFAPRNSFLAICPLIQKCLFCALCHYPGGDVDCLRRSICFWTSTRHFPSSLPSAPITFIMNFALSSSLTGLHPAHPRFFFVFVL